MTFNIIAKRDCWWINFSSRAKIFQMFNFTLLNWNELAKAIIGYFGFATKRYFLNQSANRKSNAFFFTLDFLRFIKIASSSLRSPWRRRERSSFLSSPYWKTKKIPWRQDCVYSYFLFLFYQLATFGARDFSSAVSAFCPVFIVTRARGSWFVATQGIN